LSTDPQGISPLSEEDRISEARRAVDRDYLILGRELYLAFETGSYKDNGVVSFDAYASSKGVDPGRAKRFRRVFKKFSKDLGVSFDRMLNLGYEKLKAIEPVIRRNNRDLWLHRAASMDYAALLEEVKAHKPVRKRRKEVKQTLSNKDVFEPADTAELVKTIGDDRLKPSSDGEAISSDAYVHVRKIYLVAEQNLVFDTAIEAMERRTGSTKVGYLLTSCLEEQLAHEATRSLKDDGRMRYFMNILERRYKGKLLWVKDKKVAAKLEAMIKQAEEEVERGE
jgi:predicted house-cleaning noncanonical NTP pyrophosphatase (MazG superfamily)